ncbi:MAG: beta-galactosidase [Armatimonadota bacterium]
MLYHISAISALCTIVSSSDDIKPLIGWCCFYPGTDAGMDCIAQSGADGLSVCSGGLGVEPEEGVFNFSTLEKQIKFAEENGLKLALINEMNPLFAPKWIRDKMRASGQAIKGYGDSEDTRDGGIPSIQSEIFKSIQDEIIRKTVEFINERDVNRVITHYHPGAEWWFLPAYRYSELDIDDFRLWLKSKYKTIGAINMRWDSDYTSFSEVPAPAIDFINKDKYSMQEVVWVGDGGLDCQWRTELSSDLDDISREPSSPKVTPGKTYVFSAWVKCDDLSAQGISCDIAWLDENTGKPIYGGGQVGASVYGTSDWQQISLTTTATNGAGWAQLILKTAGAGDVKISSISFVEEGSDQNLAPNPDFTAGVDTPAGWIFRSAVTTRQITHAYSKSGGYMNLPFLQVYSPRTSSGMMDFDNENAAVYDWANYWYETGAEYINYSAVLFKKYDPTRIVSTYLTFAFSFPAEWDFSQWTGISPDEVAMRGTNIDEIGLQLCAADKDPYRITACLDLVRKYGKPMWVVDLIDFTSGVGIGYKFLHKITQTSIQHGSKGLIYCSWSIGSVPDYSYYPYIPTEDLNHMLTDARIARDLVDGMDVKPVIALIEPILPASPADKDGFKNDFHSFMGWYKVLENMQITFDVVTLNEIEKDIDLSGYRMLVVPDCRYIQDQVKTRLDDYVNEGGEIVLIEGFAKYDEIGNELRQSLRQSTIPDYGKDYCGRLLRDTHAGNTPPLFLWREDTPETDAALESAIKALKIRMDESGILPDVELVSGNPGIRSVVYDNLTSRAVYLVNMDEDDSESAVIRVKCSKVSKVEVFADLKEETCGYSQSDGYIELNLPMFASSCIVKLFN